MEIRSDRFFLLPKGEKPAGGNEFVLQWSEEGEKKEIPIPGDWLIPAEEARAEEGNVVSSFRFANAISSFPIGRNLIGLHISSFHVQEGGSLQAAAGRDLFLTFNTGSNALTKGIIDLGITKERVRQGGCFSARTSHFIAADVNGDGYFDIGVITEQMRCEERYDVDKGIDIVTGPIFAQQPALWYVFKEDHWEHDPAYDGFLDVRFRELPLIGIDMSPVDFAAYVTWKSYDPKYWRSTGKKHPEYLPGYREGLISGTGIGQPANPAATNERSPR